MKLKTSSLVRLSSGHWGRQPALARPWSAWTAIKRSISTSRIGNLGQEHCLVPLPAPKCARQSLVSHAPCPAPLPFGFAWPAPHFHSPPTVQIEPVRNENVSAHARHTRVHPIIPMPSHLIGKGSLYVP